MDEAATGLNHISLDELTPAEISTFREALEQAYLDVERQGSGSFSTSEFYDGFTQRFRELLEMLASSDKMNKN